MKQKYILIRSFSLWFLLTTYFCLSCSRSTMDAPEHLPEDASFTFKLELPSHGTPRTYADDTSIAKDEEVEKVSILVFQAKDDSTGQFLYSRSNSMISTDNKFTVSLKLSAVAVRVHVFANPPVGSLSPPTYPNKTEKEILASIHISDDLNASTSYTLPMHACLELPNITIGDINEEVKLLRSVARVDVQIQDSIPTSRFKLHGMAIYFTPDKGRLVSTSKLEGTDPNLSISAPTMPESYTVLQTKENVPRAAVATPGDKVISNSLFIYENQDFTKTPTATQNNSRMVVSGYYDNSSDLSFYPIDFRRTDAVSGNKEFMAVLRNHQYILNVTHVTGAGYEDEETAANSVPADITASIIAWTQISEDIIFDGVNYFHIEKKNITLSGGSGSSGSLIVGSSVEPNLWEMRWKGGGDYTTDPIDDSFFKIKKPTTKEGGRLQITASTTVSTPITKVLQIRVAQRLVMDISITQQPNNWGMDDWIPDGNNDHDIDFN